MAIVDAVADHSFAKRSSELWRKVTNFIRVWEQNQVGADLRDYLRERERKAIRRICRQQWVLDEQHFRDVLASQLICERGHSVADYRCGKRSAGIFCDLLRGGERFKACFVPLAVALLVDGQNLHLAGVLFAFTRKFLKSRALRALVFPLISPLLLSAFQ